MQHQNRAIYFYPNATSLLPSFYSSFHRKLRSDNISALSYYEYHSSAFALSKKGKKHSKHGKDGQSHSKQRSHDGNDNNDKDDEVIEVFLPDVNTIKEKMDKSVRRFELELSKLRVGRPSADMFNDLQVDSNGQLSYLAQVTMKNPNTVSIAPYDPSMAQVISNTVRDCGLNLNPTVEGNMVEVFVPKPSQESRQALLKTAARVTEKFKLDVRHTRKLALDAAKKCKGVFSEDDIKRNNKEVEQLTELSSAKIIEAFHAKEKDINQ